MTLVLKHKFQSLKVDGGDSSLIRPSNWNDDHDLEGQAWSLPFRAAGTAGDMSDVAIGEGLFFNATTGKLDINLTGLAGFFFMNTPPAGWLKANGAAISRTTYATLFAKISTLYGAGDGSTTFNLPDIRGYFARAWDDARGVDVGRTFGSYQPDFPASHAHTASSGTVSNDHTHFFSANTGTQSANHVHGSSTGQAFVTYSGGAGGQGSSGGGYSTAGTTGIENASHYHGVSGSTGGISANHTHAITVNAAGGDGRPKNLALLGCIKY